MFAGLENTMGHVAERLSTNKVLIAIRDGFLSRYTINYRSVHFPSYCQLPSARV